MMTERMEVECHAKHCLNHDDYGCVKGYIEVGKDGFCIYYEEPSEEDTEGEED